MLFALYQKISKIVVESSEELGNVIMRLGGSHLLMSVMGAVGNIMVECGLKELWSTFICVTHGHRPYILPCTQSALSDSRSVDHNPHEDLEIYLTTHAKTVFVKFITSFWEVLIVVAEILDNIPRICDHMKELWIQYFEQIMRPFVRAERTGDWHLHFYAGKQMLSLPACCSTSCLRQV